MTGRRGKPSEPAERVVRSVLGRRGRLPLERRVSAFARSYSIGLDGDPPDAADAAAELIDKLARGAYAIDDEDVTRALGAGYSDDELFELVIAGAVGAGLVRRDAGLAAVDRWERER